jgi:hypothetical protein
MDIHVTFKGEYNGLLTKFSTPLAVDEFDFYSVSTRSDEEQGWGVYVDDLERDDEFCKIYPLDEVVGDYETYVAKYNREVDRLVVDGIEVEGPKVTPSS